MVDNCLYAMGQVTVKVSLCLLYRQIFTSRTLHRIIDVTIVYSVAWGIAFVGVALFSCRPIHAFWDFTLQGLPTTYCINNHAWYVGQAVPNILTDILVLCMPLKQVWALKLDKKSKTALLFIFTLGILYVLRTHFIASSANSYYNSVCVISVIRVISLFAIDNTNPTCKCALKAYKGYHKLTRSNRDSGRNRELELRRICYCGNVRQPPNIAPACEVDSPKQLQIAANTTACY